MKCDRKTLYDDIELLKAEGYEILSRMKKHSKVYYVSDRKFSPIKNGGNPMKKRIYAFVMSAAMFLTGTTWISPKPMIASAADHYP